MSYEYETAGSGTENGRNTLRRKRLIMPNGAYVTYSFASEGHGAGHSDWASRVSSVLVDLDGSGGTFTPVSVATYAYNGVGHVVGVDYPEPDVMSLAYATGSPNAYGNLDRFNRVVTSAWTKDLATDHDFFNVAITYDDGSNITAVEDNVLGTWDYKYTIDDLYRLTQAKRGDLSGGSISNPKFDQQWTLDQVGNWDIAKLDRNGDSDFIDMGDYNDDRTHNDVNELTARDTDDNGTNNFTLTYFKTGAMKNDGENYKYVWDAFGRLKEVLDRSDDSLVAEYTYNGLGFRISEHHDSDADGDVDANDATYHFVYDDSWRIIATYRDDDANPKEQFVYHNAGDSGYGSSSYIDAVILRDADFTGAWNAQADSTLETRHYYCQNWRADVSVIIDDSAIIVERAMYSPYGVPFGIPAGDFVTSATFAEPADGTVNSADSSYLLGAWGAGYDIADLDNDGDVDGADQTIMNNNWGATLGWGALSLNHNRFGYAGYVFDEALAGTKWHVRYRVLESVLGRWVSRDPIGYSDGMSLQAYVKGHPVQFTDPTGLKCVICRPDVSDCKAKCKRRRDEGVRFADKGLNACFNLCADARQKCEDGWDAVCLGGKFAEFDCELMETRCRRLCWIGYFSGRAAIEVTYTACLRQCERAVERSFEDTCPEGWTFVNYCDGYEQQFRSEFRCPGALDRESPGCRYRI